MNKVVIGIAFLCAFALAGVAGWFSITGLMAIFAGLPISIAIMASVMEVTKLVAASILYRNWKTFPLSIKSYLFSAIIVLMFITSLGIYGYLSKAHLDQNAPVTNNIARIERLEQKIETEQYKITEAEGKLTQLDGIISTLIAYDKISGPDGARAVKDKQQLQRDLLDNQITTSQTNIDKLIDEKFEYEQSVREFENEVGPIKYIAALVYDDPSEHYDSAVRVIILMLVFVFDPLAVLLLIAANHVQMYSAKKEPEPELTLEQMLDTVDSEEQPEEQPEEDLLTAEPIEDDLDLVTDEPQVLTEPATYLDVKTVEHEVKQPTTQHTQKLNPLINEFSSVPELTQARTTVLSSLLRNMEDRSNFRELTADEKERYNLIKNIIAARNAANPLSAASIVRRNDEII